MSPGKDLDDTFSRLKAILQPHAGRLKLTDQQPGHYSLDAPLRGKFGKPMFFAGIRIQKNYVSFYLMPVYIYPELLDNLSPALKNHLKGKSCFHFKAPEEALFTELADLVALGLERYRQAELVE